MSRMKEACRYLKGRHNFQSFCDGKIGMKNPFRNIQRISISNYLPPVSAGRSPDTVSVDVEGDSFLCHMVRIIVGTLVDVGRKALYPEDIKEILKSGDRTLAGKTLPAKGLFLLKVYYY